MSTHYDPGIVYNKLHHIFPPGYKPWHRVSHKHVVIRVFDLELARYLAREFPGSPIRRDGDYQTVTIPLT